jgi:hypothetical protein
MMMESVTINLEKEQALGLREIAKEIGLNLEEFIQMLAEHVHTESEVKAQYIAYFKMQLENKAPAIQRPTSEELREAMDYILKKNEELYKRLA